MVVKFMKFVRPSTLNMPIDCDNLENSELPHHLRTILSQNEPEKVNLALVEDENGKYLYISSDGKFRCIDLREDQHPIVLCYLMESQGSGYVYIEGSRRIFSFGEGYGVEEINQARTVAIILSEFLEYKIDEMNFGAVR